MSTIYCHQSQSFDALATWHNYKSMNLEQKQKNNLQHEIIDFSAPLKVAHGP